MSEQPPKQSATPGTPGRQSRLGLAALLLGVLALPTALMPVLGIVISLVVLIIALIALIRAVRRPEFSWVYPGIAVVIAVLALGTATLITNAANDKIQACGATTVDEANDCLKNN